MNLIRNLTIGRRLFAAFGCVVALTLASAAFSLWHLGTVQALADALTTVQARRTELAYRWRNDTSLNASRTLALGAISDPAMVDRLKAQMKETTADVSRIQKEFEALEQSPDGLKVQQELAAVRVRYLAAREALAKARALGATSAGADAQGEATRQFEALFTAYIAASDRLVAHQQRRAAESGAEITRSLRDTRVVGGACALAGVLLSTLLGWRLARGIVGPLAAAEAAARQIAGGDLTHAWSPHGSDETGRLSEALARMQQALKVIVGDIRLSTDAIRLASAEVASGNQDLSNRTEQTAGSLQQAASSMDQLTGTVRASADSAAQANRLAADAAALAQLGGGAVAGVVATMGEIDASSRRIADILGVIDGIAFQTNILALNAAVEAARAGEQGRGFAVVAAEVRSLAGRSADAAREIKVLIGDSVSRVESGTRQVQDAGRTMTEIVAAVQRVNEVIAGITAAAGEQSAGIQQVNDAVVLVDRMTQQNAALVEQSAAAAESMKDQADRLSKTVEVFRTA